MDKFDEDREAIVQIMKGLGLILVIPIISGNVLIGMLGLGPKIAEAWYSNDDVELLQTLMMQTAISIKNAQKVEELKSMVELQASYRELERVESTMRQASNEWRRTFDSIPDMIMVIDRKYRLLKVNKAASQIFGQSFKELIGQSYHKVLYGTEAPPENCPLHRTMIDGEQHIEEIKLAGLVGDFLGTATPLTGESEELIGLVLVVRDITERKRMEEEILKTQKLESLGMLSGGIAHDFNNTLAGILVNISHAKKIVNNNDMVVELLAEAENATLGARGLTQQLLTFSKGGAPIKKIVPIGRLLKESAMFVLRGSNILCDFSIPDDLWAVEIDQAQISQVIHNLIINAIQASTRGSTIRAEAQNFIADDKTKIRLKSGRYVRISIIDQGVGISEKNLSKIFDPFFTTKKQGSGLGLATSYSIVKKHGGLITVESTEGAGTSFAIYLPASTDKIPESKATEQKPVALKGKILVMDDDAIVRNSVSRLLKDLACEVEVAANGDEAVGLYAKAMESGLQFDAVILDLTVRGGMGGKEAIDRLKEMDPNVNAIVASGYSNDQVLTNFRNYGFRSVIRKPYSIETLLSALSNMKGSEK